MAIDNLNYFMHNFSIFTLLLITARFYGVIVICPLFSKSAFPRLFQTLLALGLAIPVFIGIARTSLINLGVVYKIALLAKEFIVGIALGYAFSLPIWMIENIGNLVDTQRGEQMGAVISQLTHNPSSSVSKLMLQGFICYIVMANGLLFLVKWVMQSFNLIPYAQLTWNHHITMTTVISMFSDYFYWVVILSLPVVFALLIVEVVLGLLSSFIQQLNVTVVSVAIKGVLGIFMLVFYIGVLYHVVLSRFMQDVQSVLS